MSVARRDVPVILSFRYYKVVPRKKNTETLLFYGCV
jgi:hypothetical protein